MHRRILKGSDFRVHVPYLTSGTVMELSAIFVERMILRLFDGTS